MKKHFLDASRIEIMGLLIGKPSKNKGYEGFSFLFVSKASGNFVFQYEFIME